MSTYRRWTYLTVEVKPKMMGGLKLDEIQNELVRQGSQGWELVNIVVPAPLAGAVLVFKKEL